MEYPFGQLESAILTGPSQLLGPPLQPFMEMLEGPPWLCATLPSSNYKHRCVISFVFLLEPKHGIIPDTPKKIIPPLLNLCVKARSQVALLIYALLELSDFYPPWIDEAVSNLSSLL